MVILEKDKKKKVAKVVRRDEFASTFTCNAERHFLIGKNSHMTTLKLRSYNSTMDMTVVSSAKDKEQ